MQDKKYLLSIAQLLEEDNLGQQEALVRRCLKWLDAERGGRLRRLQSGKHRKVAEHIGAGMLLQLAVLQAVTEDCLRRIEVETVEERAESAMASDESCGDEIVHLTISGLLKVLEQSSDKPLPLEYTYGENGKPYLKNYPYYFNLSHSGEYIFCVISSQEIGVDIQWTKPLKDDRIARRFFSEKEQQELARCHTQQERQELFYRLWACKEAYGKLTGQGITAVLGEDIRLSRQDRASEGSMAVGAKEAEYKLEEYEIEDYRIAVCKWKQES